VPDPAGKPVEKGCRGVLYICIALKTGAMVPDLAFVDGADVVYPAATLGTGELAIPALAPHPQGENPACFIELGVVHPVSGPSQ
jgi:hypothetical protein